MNLPRYERRPIGSIRILARILGTNPRHLQYLARNSSKYYYPGRKLVKPDGTTRQTLDAAKPLKIIQQKIRRRILEKVEYPSFLLGGIKGRGHWRNARLHTGKKSVVGEDVENFFASISAKDVEGIFKHFFQFPSDVARVLAQLTTHLGSLPQGACTSTHVANLLFWDKESVLEFRLRKKNIEYTRYVDDSNASSDSDSRNNLSGWTKSKIREMYATKNLRAKETKSVQLTRKRRMSIHNLTINGPHPTLSKKKQSELKSDVRRLEEVQEIRPVAPDMAKQIASLRGKLLDWNRYQPTKARRQLDRLLNLKSE
jgi:hypothetical protein